MSPTASFHSQLASIMEVLANTAVAEICELVDSGYAVLQLEISRSRKENEVLRRKLRLLELRAARSAALRAAAAAASGSGGAALLYATGRPRVQQRVYEPRRSATLTELSSSSNQLAPLCGETRPQSAAVVIKVEDVEDEEESWSRADPHETFCGGSEDQAEAEASSSLIRRPAADNGEDGYVSWAGGEVSSTSTNQRPETGAYDSLVLRHASRDPPAAAAAAAEPGSSGSVPSGNAPADSGSGFSRSDAGPRRQQQGAPRRQAAGSQSSTAGGDGWRPQSRDAGGRTFVCSFCGKTLACLKNLKTHMRVHTGEKPYACARCGKRFSDSSNLKRHQSVHTGEKRYGCAHCGKRFAQSGSLKVHMSVHTGGGGFRCSSCGKTFTSGGHLRRHVAAHAGERWSAAAAP